MTQDVPYKYAVVLFGYILPFLLIITIIANTLIVIVLAQSHMRTPTNLVLLAMAIADLLTLVFPAPWYFYMYTFGNHAKILYPPSACYTYHLMVEVTPAFFHTASIWLTLLLAGQRYGICFIEFEFNELLNRRCLIVLLLPFVNFGAMNIELQKTKFWKSSSYF